MSEVTTKVEKFFDQFRIQNFKKGHILVLADAQPEGIYLLLKGEVGQYDISDQGQKVMVNVFKTRAFFPMSWALNETPNEYFYEALSDIEYRMSPKAEAVEFLKANPDVTFDLLKRVYKGADGLLKRTAHLMGGRASTRLIFEIVTACRRSRNIAEDLSCELDINESDLASRSGLSRETVNREIHKLKAADLVKVKSSKITVINVDKLEELLSETL